MPRELNLKGTNFRGVVQAVERRSPEQARAVLAAVKGPAGAALRDGELVANGWYPASWYEALLVAVSTTFGEPGIVRDLAREAITNDFKTLFKIVVLIVTPESALKNTMRVVSRYVDGGRTEVVDAREGFLHFRFEEFFGYTPLMWEDWQGGMEAILDLMKVRRLSQRVLSGGKLGDDRLEIVVRFSRQR